MCCGIFATLFLFADTVLFLILSGSCIYFFSYAGYSSMYTIVPESYPTEIRSTAMGWMNAWNKIGGIVAPALFGVFLELEDGFEIVVISAAGLFLVIGILGVFTEETREKGGKEIK